MKSLSKEELNKFVNDNIDLFHKSKIKSLLNLNLKNLLKKKNPYLFKAKNIHTVSELVQGLLDAHISSSEEEIFGKFLEELALYISSRVYNGKKSSASGVDLEFTNKGSHYLVSIKSGTNWGNSSQQKKQEIDFQKAARVLKQSNLTLNIQPILGICYGNTKTSILRGYTKVVGQSFWYLISGNKKLYTDIIEPIGYKAKEHTENYLKEKSRIINLFDKEFTEDFCINGNIDWLRLVKFNSQNL